SSADTPTPELYTLSLHDALPISAPSGTAATACGLPLPGYATASSAAACARHRESASSPGCHSHPDHAPAPGSCLRCRPWRSGRRSEEHTSELQSRENLVCRLLLE